jgi:hypothetical protein
MAASAQRRIVDDGSRFGSASGRGVRIAAGKQVVPGLWVIPGQLASLATVHPADPPPLPACRAHADGPSPDAGTAKIRPGRR